MIVHSNVCESIPKVLQLISSEKRKPTNKQEFAFGKSNYCSVKINFFQLVLDDCKRFWHPFKTKS